MAGDWDGAAEGQAVPLGPSEAVGRVAPLGDSPPELEMVVENVTERRFLQRWLE